MSSCWKTSACAAGSPVSIGARGCNRAANASAFPTRRSKLSFAASHCVRTLHLGRDSEGISGEESVRQILFAAALGLVASAASAEDLKIALIYGKTGPLEAYAKQTETGLRMG